MFSEHYVYFVTGRRYSGPFQTFEAAFSYAIKFQADFRIEDANDKILATWSLWTGLYKVGAVYHFLVVDNEFNRVNCPDLIGQTFVEKPMGAMVQDVEAA